MDVPTPETLKFLHITLTSVGAAPDQALKVVIAIGS
jgi:hypothetical protein